MLSGSQAGGFHLMSHALARRALRGRAVRCVCRIVQVAGGRALGDALAANATLEVLTLSRAALRDRGTAGLARGLAQNHHLKSLDLSHNGVAADGAAAVAAALRGAAGACPLAALDLSHNAVGDWGVTGMARSLPAAAALRDLSLQDCDIGPAGAPLVVHVLRVFAYRRGLEARVLYNQGATCEPLRQLR